MHEENIKDVTNNVGQAKNQKRNPKRSSNKNFTKAVKPVRDSGEGAHHQNISTRISKQISSKTHAVKHWYSNKIEKRRRDFAQSIVDAFSEIASKSFRIIIPWLILSTLVYATGAYFIFTQCFVGRGYPVWYLLLIIILLFGIFTTFGFFYGVYMALLHTVLIFSTTIGEVIKGAISRLKNSIESKIDRAAEIIEKRQVMQIIRQTFDELSQNIRRYAAGTVVGLFVATALGSIIFVLKKMAENTFSKIKNKGEFFTVLSVRVALILAIILNLKFFTKLALWLGYLIGIIVLGGQVLLYYLIR